MQVGVECAFLIPLDLNPKTLVESCLTMPSDAPGQAGDEYGEQVLDARRRGSGKRFEFDTSPQADEQGARERRISELTAELSSTLDLLTELELDAGEEKYMKDVAGSPDARPAVQAEALRLAREAAND